jgi:hypothetical protein
MQPGEKLMNQHDRKMLARIRAEIQDTLRASERRPRNVTEHERLEDISYKLTRTLQHIDTQIASLDTRSSAN